MTGDTGAGSLSDATLTPDDGHPRLSVSVVICCCHDERFGDVCDAVASVRAQCHPVDETVVVVDHNPSLLVRLVRALPDTRVVESRNARGLSGARNTGVSSTSGNLVVFLDDDARARPDMVRHMVRAAAMPGVLGVSADVRPDWEGAPPGWFPDEFLWVVGCTYEGVRAGPVRNPIGAAMAVRRYVLDDVGGFATEFGRGPGTLPMGCEETELAIRARHAFPGRHFVHVPEAACLHKVPVSRAKWRYLVRRCRAEGLSKAALARSLGKGDALSSERSYLVRTLPRGVLRGLYAAGCGDLGGLARVVAILVGLACTADGYLVGRTTMTATRTPVSTARETT